MGISCGVILVVCSFADHEVVTELGLRVVVGVAKTRVRGCDLRLN